MNSLKRFFYQKVEGQGIWKWDHYFEIYERHFAKFKRKKVNVLEIGIYSGGSLEMWKEYFGKAARIIGVDIESECEAYEREGVKIYIGDQGDREFWKDFKFKEPLIDILIDDGSHKKKHQRITFNEMFGHLRPGGVYLCEDIHGYPVNDFGIYLSEMANGLYVHDGFLIDRENNDRYITKKTTDLQRDVRSVSIYPYVCVVEKNEKEIEEFIAPRRGTKWAPFRP